MRNKILELIFQVSLNKNLFAHPKSTFHHFLLFSPHLLDTILSLKYYPINIKKP